MPPSKRKRSSQAAAAASAEARAEAPATVTVQEQEAGGGQEPWSWQPHIVAAREKAHRAGRVGPTHPDVMPDIIRQVEKKVKEARGCRMVKVRIGIALYKWYLQEDEFGNKRYQFMYDSNGRRLSKAAEQRKRLWVTHDPWSPAPRDAPHWRQLLPMHGRWRCPSCSVPCIHRGVVCFVSNELQRQHCWHCCSPSPPGGFPSWVTAGHRGACEDCSWRIVWRIDVCRMSLLLVWTCLRCLSVYAVGRDRSANE